MKPPDYREDVIGCRFCKYGKYSYLIQCYVCLFGEKLTSIKFTHEELYEREVADNGTCSQFKERE